MNFSVRRSATFTAFALGPRMTFGHGNNHLVVPNLCESKPHVVTFETDKTDLDFTV
jgi:hypothetical protein